MLVFVQVSRQSDLSVLVGNVFLFTETESVHYGSIFSRIQWKICFFGITIQITTEVCLSLRITARQKCNSQKEVHFYHSSWQCHIHSKQEFSLGAFPRCLKFQYSYYIFRWLSKGCKSSVLLYHSFLYPFTVFMYPNIILYQNKKCIM